MNPSLEIGLVTSLKKTMSPARSLGWKVVERNMPCAATLAKWVIYK